MMEFTNTLVEFNKLNDALVTALGKAGSLADSHEVVVNQETTFTNIT